MISGARLTDDGYRGAVLRPIQLPRGQNLERIACLARGLVGVHTVLVGVSPHRYRRFSDIHPVIEPPQTDELPLFAEALASEAALIVGDTSVDLRFADAACAMAGVPFRFYASCPIKASDGTPIGVLCLLGGQARVPSRQDRLALEVLVNMVEAEFSALGAESTDRQTGLPNHASFVNIGQFLSARYRRRGQKVQLLRLQVETPLSDVNFASLAASFTTCFRDRDLVARLSERQLAAVLPCSAAEIPVVAMRVGRMLQQFNSDRPPVEQAAASLTYFEASDSWYESLERLLEERH